MNSDYCNKKEKRKTRLGKQQEKERDGLKGGTASLSELLLKREGGRFEEKSDTCF